MADTAVKIPFSEAAAPSTPASGKVVIYAKSDGLMYSKDDAGAETLMSSGGSGSVATDSIWDAAGDLAVGSGSNTAVKLTMGSANGMVVQRAAGAVAWGYVPYIGCRVYNNGVQSIGSGSAVVLTFDTEDEDTNGFHAGGSPTRLTAPISGVYLVTGRTFFPFTASTKKYLGLALDGTTATPIRRVGASLTASEDTIDICIPLRLTATQYLELTLEHDNGSSQNAGHATARRVQSEFTMQLIGV